MELWRERRLWSVGRGHAVPAMHVDLVMSERQGIEIDYCPQFRDIWLGRTELDKIIDRSSQFSAPQEKALPQQASSGWTAPLQNAAPSPPPPSSSTEVNVLPFPPPDAGKDHRR